MRRRKRGAASVGAWLSRLATERLRHLGRFVPRLVLRWQRSRFKALRLNVDPKKAIESIERCGVMTR